ncbi:MAG: FHA domain-containing protein [Mycobacteriales bacterium]|nr:MAG: hypothetical protein DLM56_15135 [Pseudonocardiales bacterium]
MTACPRCGRQNSDDARFCSHCGAQLSRSDSSPETTSILGGHGLTQAEEAIEAAGVDDDLVDSLEALPPDTALLVVKRGPNAGSRFLLDRDVTTAGRHPDSDIFLDDVTVSRRHAEFRRESGHFLVHDVGSLNGTYLGRERIESSPLAGGDEVQIGKFRLIFLVGVQGTADHGQPAAPAR